MFDPRDLGVGGEAGRQPPAPVAQRGVRQVDLDWRSVAWGLAAFVALVAVSGLVRAAPRAITVLAIGSLLGLGLDPVVSRLERRMHGYRALAVAMVMIGLVAVAAVVGALLAPRAIEEGERLTSDVDKVLSQTEKLPVVGKELRQQHTADKIRTWLVDLPKHLQGNDTPIGEAAVQLADGLLVAGFTVILTVALLLDGPRLVRGVCRAVPARHRDEVVRIGRLAYSTVARYIAGSLLVASIAGVATLVAGLLLRVPLTPLVAVWVAIFDLVPQIGGAAGGIPFVLLGLTRSAGTAAACAVFFVLYLQFENHVLSPLVVGRAVKLSPPATMTAALVGVSAGGVVGALLAVPVVAAAKAVYVELRAAPAPAAAVTADA
jgi:predicted PurR-regulated permease PerM